MLTACVAVAVPASKAVHATVSPKTNRMQRILVMFAPTHPVGVVDKEGSPTILVGFFSGDGFGAGATTGLLGTGATAVVGTLRGGSPTASLVCGTAWLGALAGCSVEALADVLVAAIVVSSGGAGKSQLPMPVAGS